MADEQRQGLAHAIVYPAKAKATGFLKTTVDLWQRRCILDKALVEVSTD
jgi:hypothetical protein